MSNKNQKIKWRASHKLKHLADSFYLKNEILGAYLRRNGLHLSDLETWKREASQAFDGARTMRNEEKKRLEIRVKFLEKELEKANLKLELQKKVQLILNPIPEEEKQSSSEESKSSNSSVNTDNEG